MHFWCGQFTNKLNTQISLHATSKFFVFFPLFSIFSSLKKKYIFVAVPRHVFLTWLHNLFHMNLWPCCHLGYGKSFWMLTLGGVVQTVLALLQCIITFQWRRGTSQWAWDAINISLALRAEAPILPNMLQLCSVAAMSGELRSTHLFFLF